MNRFFVSLILTVFVFSVNTNANSGDDAGSTSSKLTLGGMLQAQYQYVDAEDTSRMIMRRARLTIASQLTNRIKLKLQVEAGKGNFTLKDAYIGLNLKNLDIFIGQKHVPFSREALNSAGLLQMIERSRSSEFAPFRQLGFGIQAFALDKKLEFMAGIYNGAVNNSAVSGLVNNRIRKVQIYFVDLGGVVDNNKFLYAGRIDFHPLGYMKKEQSYLQTLDHPLLSFGINYYTSDDTPKGGHTAGAAELKKTMGYGADAAFKFKGAAAAFEYIHRDVSWWGTANQVNKAPQFTYTLQGGFMVIPMRFELAARYEYVEFDIDKFLLGPEGQNCDKWLTLGFNYFLEGHKMKIQFNYIMKKEDMPGGIPEPDNDTILVQFAYNF